MRSCVLIIPVAERDQANALAEAMGWGPNNYSVPLSTAGTDPATHYGLRAGAEDSFEAMLGTAQADGTMPQPLIDAGFPADTFAAIVAAVIADFRDDPTGHFDDICAAHGLQRINPPEVE